MITKLDFVGVPSTESERTRAFYVDTLGLRPDPNARFEFWVGETRGNGAPDGAPRASS